MRKTQDLQTILDAKAANGVGNAILVEGYRHKVLQIDSAGSANLTIKVQASDSDTAPDFSAAQSVTNSWDYVQCKDLQDGSSKNGDTGLAFAGSDDHVRWEINDNGAKWINVEVSGYTAGTITVKIKLFND